MRDCLPPQAQFAQSSCRHPICWLTSCQHPVAYMPHPCDTLAIGMMPTGQACMPFSDQTRLSISVLMCRTGVCFHATAYSILLMCSSVSYTTAAAATSTSV